MKEFIAGLNILLSYAPPSTNPQMGAEHDEIFADGPAPEKMRPEHAKHLEALNWRWDATLPSWRKFT